MILELELITSKECLYNVWTKSPISAFLGKEYYISFMDNYSRYVWGYFLHNNSHNNLHYRAKLYCKKAQSHTDRIGMEYVEPSYLSGDFLVKIMNIAAYLINVSFCSMISRRLLK